MANDLTPELDNWKEIVQLLESELEAKRQQGIGKVLQNATLGIVNSRHAVSGLRMSLGTLDGELKNLNKGIKDGSDSSNKYSNAMKWLTGGLVALGLAQFGVAYLEYRGNQDIIDVKKNCYQSVLQTSSIDLNYKNCLRSHGLSD